MNFRIKISKLQKLNFFAFSISMKSDLTYSTKPLKVFSIVNVLKQQAPHILRENNFAEFIIFLLVFRNKLATLRCTIPIAEQKVQKILSINCYDFNTVKKLHKFTLTQIFEKSREINVFTKEITNELI